MIILFKYCVDVKNCENFRGFSNIYIYIVSTTCKFLLILFLSLIKVKIARKIMHVLQKTFLLNKTSHKQSGHQVFYIKKKKGKKSKTNLIIFSFCHFTLLTFNFVILVL